MEKFFVQNFGCRATQADGAAIEKLLTEQGLGNSTQAQSADLVVLNTCTVTAAADEDVRSSIRRVHRENPAARILVTGCYAQRAPEELRAIDGVTWVVGNSHKTRIPEILRTGGVEGTAPYHGHVFVSDISAQEFLSAPIDDAFGDRTRPNLKIQDGCNNVCTFCVIPSVRGRSRSMRESEVLDQLTRLGERYAEVVLTGINLGRWGRDGDRLARLAGLVERILAETPVQRLRLSSIEPMDFSNALLELMAGSPRIAPHVHAPLQSGCDTVLRRMKRRYRARHYEDRIRTAHALLPDAAFGADVMTGFPGETDDEFRETYEFIERMPFTYLHVFTYSERPGTPAASLPQVPVEIRRARTRQLRELSDRKNREFRQRMVGRTLSAVTLPGGTALTGNYLKVELAEVRDANRIVPIEIGGLTAAGLREKVLLPVLA